MNRSHSKCEWSQGAGRLWSHEPVGCIIGEGLTWARLVCSRNRGIPYCCYSWTCVWAIKKERGVEKEPLREARRSWDIGGLIGQVGGAGTSGQSWGKVGETSVRGWVWHQWAGLSPDPEGSTQWRWISRSRGAACPPRRLGWWWWSWGWKASEEGLLLQEGKEKDHSWVRPGLSSKITSRDRNGGPRSEEAKIPSWQAIVGPETEGLIRSKAKCC